MHLAASAEWTASRGRDSSHVDHAQSGQSCEPCARSVAAAAALVVCNSRCYYAYKTLRKALWCAVLPWPKQLALTRLLVRSKQVKSTELWAHHGAVVRAALETLILPSWHLALTAFGHRASVRGVGTQAVPTPPAAERAVDFLRQDFQLTLAAATAHKRIAYAWQHRWKLSQVCVALAGVEFASATAHGTGGEHSSANSPHCPSTNKRMTQEATAASLDSDDAYYKQLQEDCMHAVLGALLCSEEWLRLRPGDHSAWHWRWNTWRIIANSSLLQGSICSQVYTEHTVAAPADPPAAAAAAAAVASCVVGALWARELLFVAYVNSVHQEHPGLEAAARNIFVAVGNACHAGCGSADCVQLRSCIAACQVPTSRNTLKEHAVGQERHAVGGLEGGSSLWKGGPCIRPNWADGVLGALLPGSGTTTAAILVMSAFLRGGLAGLRGGWSGGVGSGLPAVASALAAEADWLQLVLETWPKKGCTEVTGE